MYCSLAGRYDNPIPTSFLAFIGFSKIPALGTCIERAKLQEDLHLYGVLLLAGYDIQTTVGPLTALILHLGKMADILSADVHVRIQRMLPHSSSKNLHNFSPDYVYALNR